MCGLFNGNRASNTINDADETIVPSIFGSVNIPGLLENRKQKIRRPPRAHWLKCGNALTSACITRNRSTGSG